MDTNRHLAAWLLRSPDLNRSRLISAIYVKALSLHFIPLQLHQQHHRLAPLNFSHHNLRENLSKMARKSKKVGGRNLSAVLIIIIKQSFIANIFCQAAAGPPFPFLKLPAELRNKIYELALTSEKRVVLKYHFKNGRRRVPFRAGAKAKVNGLLNPAILRACRQVCAEALPVLYNQPFEFMNALSLQTFLEQIGKDAVKSLQTVTILTLKVANNSEVTHPAFRALANAANLNALNILDFEISYRVTVFADIQVGALARFFFPVAHIWLEQMEKNMANCGKDWRDVLNLANGKVARCKMLGINNNAPPDEFCKDVEKLLKE
jgi:hypothetical protein